MSLIKKEQIKYGNECSNHRIIKPSSQKFQLNVSLPKDKIEEEINLLRKEIMKEADVYRNQLDNEKELLEQEKQALLEKETILEQEKQTLLSDFSVTKEKLKKEAYEEGYKEGNEKGYDEGLLKGEKDGRKDHDIAKGNYEEALYDLINKLKELDEYKKEILENTEPYLLNLLDVIVKKLLSKSIEIDKNIMIEVVKEALLPVTSGYDLAIKVNPENVQYLEENKSKLLSTFMSVKDCEIVADADVSQGGCLIEANFGVIDSRIESKMQSIKDLICTIKDCEEPTKTVVEESSSSIETDIDKDEVVIEGSSSDLDSLFNDDDLLSLDTNLENNVFDFLTEDDE